MKVKSYELFEKSDAKSIIEALETTLKTRNESPFWADKVIPFTDAILSVLIPLRKQDMLFTPEGNYVDKLTPELFLDWSDLLSIKTLAFTIQQSNLEKELQRTKLPKTQCKKYKEIDLEILGNYLSKYSINLENETLDFPISNYNLHQGISNVIKSFL